MCKDRGCETRLSIYNPKDQCALHCDEPLANINRGRAVGVPY